MKGRAWFGLLLFFSPFTLHLTPVFGEEASAFSKAVSAYQDRKLDEALHHAREAVREDPGHVEAHLLLGQLYYLRQEMGKARESWEKALKLAPSREDVRKNLDRLGKESSLEKEFSRSDTHPFVVRFAQDRMDLEAGALREMLREAHRQVGQSFDYFPDHPITVIFYPAENFKQVQGVSHQVAGLYDGKIRLPLQSGAGGDVRLKRILWHEYAHALVHDLAKGSCPIWLNEGIATLQEFRVAPIRVETVRQALATGKLIAWEQLWKEGYTDGDLELRYAQSYQVTQYLVKRWGWPGISGLLKRLGQGYPVADALRAQYRTDPALLEKEWLAWLKRQ